MKFQTEKHLIESSGDKFHMENLAKEIFQNVLLEMTLPNCFGIYGNWGSGKSTLLHFMSTHAESDQKIQVVKFEAWKYEYSKENDLLFALLNEIKNKLGTPNKKWKEMAKIALTVAASGASLMPLVPINPKEIKENGEMIEELLYNEHELWVDSVEKLKNAFSEIVQEGLSRKKKEKLIIIIDDLDRCLPDNAVRLLETMKNFLSVEKTLVILAIDKRVMSQMIAKKYNLHPDYGDEYLMKIIHYFYELPRHNLKEIIDDAFKAHQITLTERALVFISEFFKNFEPEPRKAKYFIHGFCIKLALHAITLDQRDDNYQLRMYFVASYLLSQFPDIASDRKKLYNIRETASLSISSGTRSAEDYDKVAKIYPSVSVFHRKKIELILQMPVTTYRESSPPNITDLDEIYRAIMKFATK